MDWSEWTNLALRWFHVFAAILWIGQTWLFAWLDRQFESGAPGERVYMIHSGGFYVVEKDASPTALPPRLHWFKWEAALTWLSGVALLVVVYYMGGLMQGSPLGTTRAIVLGALLLPVGWVVYDTFIESRFGRSDRTVAVVGWLATVALAYGLGHAMSSRAAFFHVGAVWGTLMFANVWDRIIPGQQRMVAALAASGPIDPAQAARAKRRSKHNTFLVLPVLLIMLSNHFPTATYGHSFAWAMLGGLILVGWAAAVVVRKY